MSMVLPVIVYAKDLEKIKALTTDIENFRERFPNGVEYLHFLNWCTENGNIRLIKKALKHFGVTEEKRVFHKGDTIPSFIIWPGPIEFEEEVHTDNIFAASDIKFKEFARVNDSIVSFGSIYSDNVAQAEYHITAENDIKARFGIKAKYQVYAGGTVVTGGDIISGDLLALGSITAHGKIEATGAIRGSGNVCGEQGISAQREIEAKGFIGTLPGYSIESNKYIEGGSHIQSGKDILVAGFCKAKGDIIADDDIITGSNLVADSITADAIKVDGDLVSSANVMTNSKELPLQVNGMLRTEGNTRSVSSIVVACQIEAHGSIEAEKDIKAGGNIISYDNIIAGGKVQAGKDYSIFAGLGVARKDWKQHGKIQCTKKPENIVSGEFVKQPNASDKAGQANQLNKLSKMELHL